MAEVLTEATGKEVEITSGAKGDFEVFQDKTLLFSKQAEGRFPEEDEMIKLVTGG